MALTSEDLFAISQLLDVKLNSALQPIKDDTPILSWTSKMISNRKFSFWLKIMFRLLNVLKRLLHKLNPCRLILRS